MSEARVCAPWHKTPQSTKDAPNFVELREGEVRRINILGTWVNRGAATLPYICLHLVLLSVSGLAQAVVQVCHPIPLNDLRVL